MSREVLLHVVAHVAILEECDWIIAILVIDGVARKILLRGVARTMGLDMRCSNIWVEVFGLVTVGMQLEFQRYQIIDRERAMTVLLVLRIFYDQAILVRGLT